MKRRLSNCEDCLPSPEYSEPEYHTLATSNTTKKSRILQSQHEFIEAADDRILNFINQDGSIHQKKFRVKDKPTNLVLIFFGVIDDFLEPIR